MTSRSRALFRRGGMLLLSGTLAMASLAAATGAAHAQTAQISNAPANSTTCPVLTFSGSGFTHHRQLEIHLYRNGLHVTSFYPTGNGSGVTSPAVTYPNHFTGSGNFYAYAVDTGTRQLAWSNHTAFCTA